MTASSPVDLDEILIKGGAPSVALLRYCVISVTMEPLFVFLAREFQFRPTHISALALYDVFCAPEAPARVQAPSALPPRDLKLAAAVRELREQFNYVNAPRDHDDEPRQRITTPYRHLFDDVVAAIRSDAEGALARASRSYDPALEPVKSLPGGRMSVGQRNFVDRVWRPVVRPRLVVAGFRQVAAID